MVKMLNTNIRKIISVIILITYTSVVYTQETDPQNIAGTWGIPDSWGIGGVIHIKPIILVSYNDGQYALEYIEELDRNARDPEKIITKYSRGQFSTTVVKEREINLQDELYERGLDCYKGTRDGNAYGSWPKRGTFYYDRIRVEETITYRIERGAVVANYQERYKYFYYGLRGTHAEREFDYNEPEILEKEGFH